VNTAAIATTKVAFFIYFSSLDSFFICPYPLLYLL
jgi:hypothetical protein